ncbi:MAG: hypothetical protein ACK4UP_04345 [Spirosomataceae bacterium]
MNNISAADMILSFTSTTKKLWKLLKGSKFSYIFSSLLIDTDINTSFNTQYN